jgi:hypothetical protein
MCSSREIVKINHISDFQLDESVGVLPPLFQETQNRCKHKEISGDLWGICGQNATKSATKASAVFIGNRRFYGLNISNTAV